MRLAFLIAKSLATGALAVLVALFALLVTLHLYGKYVLQVGASQGVGWDPMSIFGVYWKLVLLGTPPLVFLLGCMAGFWLFGNSGSGP